MRNLRIRVQVRLPQDLLDHMKNFLPTRTDGHFAGDSLSILVERLLREECDRRVNPLENLLDEKGSLLE